MKILYQKLWVEKLGWDDPLPQVIVKEHEGWKSQLHLLDQVKISRCYYKVDEPPLSTELHGFSDASEKTYSAVVYVRSTYSSSRPLVRLVSARTKVAPLKALTIPRLELCGAQLLAKLLANVQSAPSLPVSALQAWSDSTIVLSWLDGQPKRFKTYVRNRIAATLELVPAECWFHVPTQLNPADCASRGLMPKELASFKLWWEGPEFLWAEPVSIPNQPTRSTDTAPEQRVVVHCNGSAGKQPMFLSGLYSNYHHTIKVAAWCMRFIDNLKAAHHLSAPNLISSLTLSEIKKAERFLFIQSQSLHFPRETDALRAGHAVSNKSKLLPLSPFIDQDGLLRVGERLSRSHLSLSQRHPIILCNQCELTISLFKYNHATVDPLF